MEGLTSFLQIGGFLIAMLTIYRALSEYSKNNLFQRAAILEKLIEKFNNNQLYVAKRTLDDFIVHYYKHIKVDDADKPIPDSLTADLTVVHSMLKTPTWKMHVTRDSNQQAIHWFEKDGAKLGAAPTSDEWIVKIMDSEAPKGVHQFTFISLEHLLRNHKADYIEDSEVYFRDSFDKLLDFYLLLIYYLRNEIISIREVRAHFLFHLMSVKNCEPLVKYIGIYYEAQEFEWLFKQLPDRLAGTDS